MVLCWKLTIKTEQGNCNKNLKSISCNTNDSSYVQSKKKKGKLVMCDNLKIGQCNLYLKSRTQRENLRKKPVIIITRHTVESNLQS